MLFSLMLACNFKLVDRKSYEEWLPKLLDMYRLLFIYFIS